MVSRGASLLPVKGPLSLLSCFSFSFPLGRFIGPCVYTVGLSDLFREEERRGEENFRDVSVSKKNDRPTAADNSLVRLASKQRIVSCKKSAFPLRIPSPGANHRIPNSVTFHPPLELSKMERFHLVLTIYPKRKIISKNNLVFKSCTYINKTYESKV